MLHRVTMTMTVALALLGSACSRASDFDGSGPAATWADSIVVEAVNDHFYDARVHAVFAGGKRLTLGTIAGNGGYAEVPLVWEPRALVFEISFIVSGAQYVSVPVDVARGEHVALRLPPNIDMSGYFRRVSRD